MIQVFFVSRIFKYLGVGGALFIAPALALVDYAVFAAVPVLAVIRVAKIAENAIDYSLQNTLRRALFLPTSREAKYKALQAVETFFWRAGGGEAGPPLVADPSGGGDRVFLASVIGGLHKESYPVIGDVAIFALIGTAAAAAGLFRGHMLCTERVNQPSLAAELGRTGRVTIRLDLLMAAALGR